MSAEAKENLRNELYNIEAWCRKERRGILDFQGVIDPETGKFFINDAGGIAYNSNAYRDTKKIIEDLLTQIR